MAIMWMNERYDTLERTAIDCADSEVRALREEVRRLRSRITELEGELWKARLFAIPGLAQIAPAKVRFGAMDVPHANAPHAEAGADSHARPQN